MHLLSPCRYLSLKRNKKNKSAVVVATDYHYDISLYYAFRATSPSYDPNCSSASFTSATKAPVGDEYNWPSPNGSLSTPTTDGYETCSLDSHQSPNNSVRHSSYDENHDSGPGSPLSVESYSPHDCYCKTRWECPKFVQRHFILLQLPIHMTRRSLKAMLNDYYMAVEDYAHAVNAACIPAAKLERAKAEYEWAMKRCSDRTRLLGPHLHDQVQAAQRKIAAAEKDCELVTQERLEKAQLLSDLGRF